MAVVNAYVTNNVSAKTADADIAARNGGQTVKKALFNFETVATDSKYSVYRVAKLPATAIVLGVSLACDAISGTTDLDIGVYKALEVGGDAIDSDCLKDGLDAHAGISTLTSEYAPTLANVGKSILAVAGVTAGTEQKYGSVDIAITSNAALAEAGTISGVIEYVDGV